MELTVVNKKGEKYTVLYDACDQWLIDKYGWWVSSTKYLTAKITYSRGVYKAVAFHRMVLGIENSKLHGDHINHNTLDNRRCNIRKSTPQQNMSNKKGYGAHPQYVGVCWNRFRNKWQAQIGHCGKYYYLGRFDMPEEAARAYDKKAKELKGEFANLNFKEDDSNNLPPLEIYNNEKRIVQV